MDSKELIVVEFIKTVQTAPYESENAKVGLTFSIETGDTRQIIRDKLDMVKTEVFSALNMACPPAASSDAPAKRGPGRPRKSQDGDKITVTPSEDKSATTDLDAEPAKPAAPEESKPTEEPKPEPTADDFADPPAPAEVKPIEDKQLQEECAKAAKIITPEKVKGLFQTKYGATRVSLVKQEERQKFLDDLAGLVKKAQEDAKTV